MLSSRIIVAGIGNLLMGDDAFGPMVIKALEAENLPDNVELRDMGTAGITIATDLEGFDAVIFVDSMEFSGESGELRNLHVDVEAITPKEALELSRLTVHEVGLEGLLKFSKAIGTLPDTVFIVGCKPETIDVGFGLSECVENQIPDAVKLVKKIVKKVG